MGQFEPFDRLGGRTILAHLAAGLPRRQPFWGVRSWVGALERRSRTEWVYPNKAIGETPKSVSFGLITAI
jgi:hypothetical protein